MKPFHIFIFICLLLTSCSNDKKDGTASMSSGGQVEMDADSLDSTSEAFTEAKVPEPDTEYIICNAISSFIRGNSHKVVLSSEARRDIENMKWPMVSCSEEGLRDSPSAFNNLLVKPVAPGKYRYECECPRHGDKFVDDCTISAFLKDDNTVVIERVQHD